MQKGQSLTLAAKGFEAMIKPDPVISDGLSEEAAMHGFFTRAGGVSKGIYAGLNTGLGSSDIRSDVLENRDRVAGYFGLTSANLMSPYQIHSPDVLEVTDPWEDGFRPEVDALVTSKPDIAIGIQTADCGPVLFLDAENRVAGAAHAGWKGATGGVLENTISAMEKLGADRSSIQAVLGPTISEKNYEVGPEFVDRLIALNSSNDQWLSKSDRDGHAMFNLPGYIVSRLEAGGITASWTGHCTYEDEARFFSYRRKTHRNEADYGRQISVISLK